MPSFFNYRLSIFLLWVQSVISVTLINKHSYFMDTSDASDSDVADFIISKGYLPNEKELPTSALIKNVDNDVAYLLSKLSDEELIKLLNDQPKKNFYDLQDIVNVAAGVKPYQENKMNGDQNKLRENLNTFEGPSNLKKRYRTVSDKEKSKTAFFRLDDKEVDAYNVKSELDPNYVAVQKLNNLLYSRPLENIEERSDENEEKKELLFDVLVDQLKSLCCKKIKDKKKHLTNKFQYKALINEFAPQNTLYTQVTNDKKPDEYMFLIINDEIKSNGSDELISVDPDSLEKNSSVLLLGPITTPLTDGQLKSVMNQISNELAKPDYLPLLHQLSEGRLSGNKIRLMKSLLTGPETRRYIKPHRCNHQSPLAKVYGGPKWLICTGYINLNTPSLYD